MTAIAIDKIRADGGTQPRATIDFAVVEEYANAMADGATLPPVTVFYDGTDHWLADGFHRREAHQSLGLPEIECDVLQGTRRDAVLFSVGANADHGLRRTNEDKRRAVRKVLEDIQPGCKEAGRHVCQDQHWTERCWATWSNREIARKCGVAESYVRKLKPDTAQCAQSEDRATFVHPKTGQPTQMNTARIGSTPVSRPAASPQPAQCPAAVRPLPGNAVVSEATPSAPQDALAVSEAAVRAPEHEAAERIRAEHRHAGIYHAVHAAIAAIDDLPAPEEAARLFPSSFWHVAHADDVDRVAAWWRCFSQAWRTGQSQRDAHIENLMTIAREQAHGAR